MVLSVAPSQALALSLFCTISFILNPAWLTRGQVNKWPNHRCQLHAHHKGICCSHFLTSAKLCKTCSPSPDCTGEAAYRVSPPNNKSSPLLQRLVCFVVTFHFAYNMEDFLTSMVILNFNIHSFIFSQDAKLSVLLKLLKLFLMENYSTFLKL